MYQSGQIIDIYGDGFREFDDRPPTTKAAWGLNIFWSKDNPSISDDFTLKLIVTLYGGTKGSLRILTTNKSTFTRDNSTSFDLLQSYFLIVLPDSLTYKYYQKGRMVSLQFSSKIFLHLSASCLISLSLPLPPPARFHGLKCIHVFVAHTHRSHKKKI